MISNLQLSGFTNFGETSFDFSPGINIFIGQNGTGKTHILKCIAASLVACNDFIKSDSQAKDKLEGLIADKLKGFFKPEQLGRLVKRQQGRNSASVEIIAESQTLSYSFATNSKTSVKLVCSTFNSEIKSLYIPPREMFSSYEGFLSLIANREVSFDDTYVMLARSLDMPMLRGPRFSAVKDLIEPLETDLNIKVVKENGRFYIEDNSGKMEAHLVAEGLRKLASIMYLILNGEITHNTVLFWDEPEANLNPALIRTVAGFINLLANKGVQLFIASHDYLLTHLLSLHAEYRNISGIQSPAMKFFSLSKTDETVKLEEGNTLIELENNSILDEYAAYYDLQTQFQNNSVQ
jgi:AAA15 family ATPase/GTPase